MNLNPLKLALVPLLLSTLAFAAPKGAATMDELVDGYLVAQKALAGDTLSGIPDAMKRVEQSAGAVAKGNKELANTIKSSARAVASAKDLAAAREAFKPLSVAIAEVVGKHYSGKRPLSIFNCSMANGSWVQEGSEARNPYYGAEMLACGEKISSKGG